VTGSKIKVSEFYWLIFYGIKKELASSEAFFDQLEGDKKVNLNKTPS
jgi:hypothetical protein